MGKGPVLNPETHHVPPSQQSAQGPVPKPGEPLDATVPPKPKAAPKPQKPTLVQSEK
jgi:hypothetical protein